MSSKRRLHPLAIGIFFFKRLRELFFIFIILLLPNEHLNYELAKSLALGLLILILLLSVAKFWFFDYQLTNDSLVIHSGIFKKNEIIIPFTRIQNIRNSQNFLLRPFKLLKLEIETAAGGNDHAEAVLEVVSNEVKTELFSKMNHGKSMTQREKYYQTTYVMGFRQNLLRIISTPGREIGYLIIALVLDNALDVIQMLLKNRTNILEITSNINNEELIFILVIGAVLFAINFIYEIGKFYNFTVMRTKNSLQVSRGLVKRVTKQIPLNKIQTVIVEQSLLQQIVHLASIRLQLAGSQEDDEGLDDAVYFLPLIDINSTFILLNEFLPEWDLRQPNYQLTATETWYFMRWLLLMVPSTLVIFKINPILGMLATVLVVIYCLQRIFQRKSQGYELSHNSIWIRYYSFLNRRQVLINRGKIQEVKYTTTPFLSLKNVGQITIIAKSGNNKLAARQKFVKLDDFVKIQKFYLSIT